MKLLFDTHAFIWWDSEPNKLSERVLALCHDPANELLFSVVSAWEMQIKAQLGKLKLSLPLADIVATQQHENHVRVLSIALSHVIALDNLPAHHKDPFDRLLASQAKVEGAALLSSDSIFEQYPVERLW
jgi:PIN domain nuclease of toxin-antitoxin system